MYVYLFSIPPTTMVIMGLSQIFAKTNKLRSSNTFIHEFLNSLPPGKVFMLFCRLLIFFFKINCLENSLNPDQSQHFDFSPPKVYKSHISINYILHLFCLNCLFKSRKYYGMQCGKTSRNMTCLILTWVAIHQLLPAEKMEACHLEIFFIESTSEYQTSVIFYAPAMSMAGALSVSPVCPYVCSTYLHTYVRTSVQMTSAL